MVSFLSVAYRFGNTNRSCYFIYCGSNEAVATELAKEERDTRGGKYGCAVYRFGGIDEYNNQEQDLVAYFPPVIYSSDKEPTYDYRIDFYQSLGHEFENFAKGEVLLPEDHPTLKDINGKPLKFLEPHKVDTPDWAKERYRHHKKFLELKSTGEV